MAVLYNPERMPLLDPNKHAYIIANLEKVTRQARVPMDWIVAQRVGVYCRTDAERDWATAIKHAHQTHGIAGLCYLGNPGDWIPPVERRLCAFVGFFTRAKVFASRYTPFELVEYYEREGHWPECTVLALSDFITSDTAKRSKYADAVQACLTERVANVRYQTVLYGHSPQAIQAVYGASTAMAIADNFVTVEAPRD